MTSLEPTRPSAADRAPDSLHVSRHGTALQSGREHRAAKGGRFLTVAATLLAIFAHTLAAPAAPRIEGAMLRYGSSPQVLPNSWAYLSYILQNPDSEAAEVVLSVRPNKPGATVFDKRLTLPPRTRCEGRMAITPAATLQYEVALLFEGRRIDHYEVISSFSRNHDRTRLLFINDGDAIGNTERLVGGAGLTRRARTSAVRALDVPHHWLGFGDAQAVVICSPDFVQMTAQQFRAIAEFTKRGGTLLFIRPRGILDAARTPLRELLPVQPLRIRLVETLPALENWAKQYWTRRFMPGGGADLTELPTERARLHIREGFSFVESVPYGQGVTTLRQDEFPICRWRRFGLGRVGVFTVNPNTDNMEASAAMFAAWNHFYAWMRRPLVLAHPVSGQTLRDLLQVLTGFDIPSHTVIQTVLAAYFVVLLALLLVGYQRGRHHRAWLLATGTGLLLTAGIFLAAYLQHANRPGKSASMLDLRATTAEHCSGQAILNMFAKTDCRPAFTAPSDTIAFRALAAPEETEDASVRLSMEAPLRVVAMRTENSIPNLSLQALRARTVAAAYRLAPRPPTPTPVLRYGATGTSLEPWPLPAWIRAANPRALMVCQNGLARIELRNGECVSLTPPDDILQLDLLEQKLERFLGAGLLPQPSLVVSYECDEQGYELPVALQGFQPEGRIVEIFPLQQEVETAAPVTLEPRHVRVRPYGPRGILLARHGKWLNRVLVRPSEFHELEIVVPPLLSTAWIAEATIRINVSNPGENLQFALRLLPGNAFPADKVEARWDLGVEPADADGLQFRFRELQQHGLLNPRTGTIVMLLKASQLQNITDHVEALRANTWRILDVRAALHGTMAPSADKKRL